MFVMQPNASRKRRFAYRRSQTLASLPTNLIPEVDSEQDDEYSQLLKKNQDSPTHSIESSSEMERSDGDEDIRVAEAGASGGSGGGTPTRPSVKQRRAHFQQRRSISMIAEQPLLLEHDIQPPKPKKFTRTPSTPAIFLSKVKERIREKVMQTTVEWPHAAAMVHERRQRANDALQASFSRREVGKEQIALRDLTPSRERKARNRIRSDPITNELSPSRHDSAVRPRIKSDPNPIENATSARAEPDTIVVDDSFEKPPNYREAARAALRRRSISEDTYDRGPLIHRLQGCDTLSPANSNSTNGIVCSDEDLKAIVVDHQKRRSPCPSRPVHSRTLSLDADGLHANGSKIDSQSSLESSTSTMSQKSAIIEEGTESEAKGGGGFGGSKGSRCTAQVDIYVYPEVVLDLKSKETMLHIPLLKQDQDDDTDSDEEESTSKVRECIFDENGQTWDVYGADFDPEILGDAIQSHLGRMMKRKSEEIKVMKLNQPPLNRKGSGSDCQKRAENKAGESMSFILRLLCAFAGRRQEMNST